MEAEYMSLSDSSRQTLARSQLFKDLQTFQPYSQTTKALSQSLQILPTINALSISIFVTISFETAFKTTVFVLTTSLQLYKPQTFSLSLILYERNINLIGCTNTPPSSS